MTPCGVVRIRAEVLGRQVARLVAVHLAHLDRESRANRAAAVDAAIELHFEFTAAAVFLPLEAGDVALLLQQSQDFTNQS